MPSALEGAPTHVRDAGRSLVIPITTYKDTNSTPRSIIPPPSYSTIFPPSPPSSPPTSPSILSTKSTTNPIALSPRTVSKPLLTPRSSEESVPSLDTNIISTLFPSASPIHKLPATTIDLSNVVEKWTGAVLENPGMGTRTMYVLVAGSYEDLNLRESVCGVLEKAEEELGCTGVVMCLEKNTPDLGSYFLLILFHQY